jgi:hypothetical protein
MNYLGKNAAVRHLAGEQVMRLFQWRNVRYKFQYDAFRVFGERASRTPSLSFGQCTVYYVKRNETVKISSAYF